MEMSQGQGATHEAAQTQLAGHSDVDVQGGSAACDQFIMDEMEDDTLTSFTLHTFDWRKLAIVDL